ncbi:MAG: hypothetical protein LAP39_22565 [Acidobacteriia bacterium]|jgi:hypothetical protein|nr:hypothetical protein [Terriglobia bacterium]
MTFVTSPLTPTQLLDEIPQIVGWLQSNGIDNLVIEYGSGCKLDPELLWRDIEVRRADLVSFIQSSIEQGIYSPGEADLVVQDRDRTFECLFCHESDIHLATDHESILTQAAQRWLDKGYGGFKLAASEDWEPF